MFESSYYPIGSTYHPSAPWNEKPVPEKEFLITTTQTLSKDFTIKTDHYQPITVEDEDMTYTSEDFSDTNWSDEFHDRDHYTPLQLIELFRKYLESNLQRGTCLKSPAYTQHLIQECFNWVEDETEIVPNI